MTQHESMRWRRKRAWSARLIGHHHALLVLPGSRLNVGREEGSIRAELILPEPVSGGFYAWLHIACSSSVLSAGNIRLGGLLT